MVLVPFVVSTILSVGVAFIASILNKPKKPKNGLDDVPTPLAARGVIVPNLFGRRNVNPNFLWAGDRQADTDEQGGKGGGGGGTTTTTYSESAWHALVVGPVDNLYRITQGGKTIWDTPLSRLTTPSGTSFECDDGEGNFTIYWGECDQPVDAYLAAKVGVASSWKLLCYILWNRKKLGSSPSWPLLQYEMGRWPDVTGITSPGSTGAGVNPAYAIWQLSTGYFPHGVNMPATAWDESSFQALADQANAEAHGINYLVEDGTDVDQAISDIMGDMGFMLPQYKDKLTPTLLRPIEPDVDVPLLTADHVTTRDLEQEFELANVDPEKTLYMIKWAGGKFRDRDVPVNDDGISTMEGRARGKRESLPTITDVETGETVARRRQLQLSNQKYSVKLMGMRDTRQLRAGQPFVIDDFGQLRVISVKPSYRGNAAEIEALIDSYSFITDGSITDQGGIGGSSPSLPPEPDIIVRVTEAPASVTPDPAILVWRVRSNLQVTSAEVWISLDGTTYSRVGHQDGPSAGGSLNSDILAADSSPIATGPSVSPYNADINFTLDLSASSADWNAGRQLCLIDDEVFFLEKTTAQPGGRRLDNLIRAQYGTVAADHFASASAFIVERSKLTVIKSPLITSGATIYVKTRPRTFSKAVSLSAVTPVVITMS